MMARPSNPIDRFAGFLEQAERSPLTIKNYRSDLDAFATWFESANLIQADPDELVERGSFGANIAAALTHLYD